MVLALLHLADFSQPAACSLVASVLAGASGNYLVQSVDEHQRYFRDKAISFL
jgi:hypothetical protein